MRSIAGMVIGLLAAAACGSAAPRARGPTAAPRPKVAVHTDSCPVAAIAVAGEALWVGTTCGLLRYDLREAVPGPPSRMGAAEGLPADEVTALAVDDEGGLWVATPLGVARRLRNAWTRHAAPPVGRVEAMAAPGPVLWAGGEGLARIAGAGWQRLLGTTRVTALLAEGASLWIGTAGSGLLRLHRGRELERHGPAQGCAPTDIAALARLPEGLLVAGRADGRPAVAVRVEGRFYSYRPEPALPVRAAGTTAEGSWLAIGPALWRLATAAPETPAEQRLVGVSGAEAAPAEGLPLEGPLPPPASPPATARPAEGQWSASPPLFLERLPGEIGEATVLSNALGRLWVGSDAAGVSRLGGAEPVHYRARDLLLGAGRLSVACVSAVECYLATGGPRAWRFDGRVFSPTSVDDEPGARVLATAVDGAGRVFAFHRGRDPGLRISRVESGAWVPVAMQDLEVPASELVLAFAEFAPGGRLWLALRGRGAGGEPVALGVAEVDLESGTTVFHRAYPRGADLPAGGLRVPDDVRAIAFAGGAVWLAGPAGATRIAGGRADHFDENRGLESEILGDVCAAPDGTVWVSSTRGVQAFRDGRWHPVAGAMRRKARAIAAARDGTLWVAGDGLVAIGPDGRERARLGLADGLPEGSLVDLATDAGGRLWVLTTEGLGIVEP